MAPTVLVTAAAGKQGSATVRHLLAAKAKVHALVRDLSAPAALELEKLGAKLYLGDFDDTDSLNAAFVGTTAVFLNVSPSMAHPELEVRHAKNIIEAAKVAGSVDTIVYSSVAMTGKHESFPNWGPNYLMAWYWISKAEIEKMTRDSGFTNWTILRPSNLMSNYHLPFVAFWLPDLPERHTFLTAYKPDTAMTVLDPDDVGKFAAAAITEPETYNHHEIDLGVEALTPAEIARSLSKASGTDIKAEFYSDEEVVAMSKVNPIIGSQLWENEVGHKVDFQALKKYPIKLTTFDDYLQREKAAILNTYG